MTSTKLARNLANSRMLYIPSQLSKEEVIYLI